MGKPRIEEQGYNGRGLFIVERNEVFIVCEKTYTKSWPWGKVKEGYRVLWKGPYKAAKFDNLSNAKIWISRLLKPDIIHNI